MTPYHESDGVVLYHGDNVQTMREAIPDASIDLVVTSPPYDNLRTYGGHTWDFEGLAAELWRAIKPGGVVVWIVADATEDGDESGTSFSQAMHFKHLGFKLNDTMIWAKNGVMQPTKNVPRYYQIFEYMFVFSKGKPTFNPIRDVEVIHTEQTTKTEEQFRNSAFAGLSGQYTPSQFRKRDNVWVVGAGFCKSTKDKGAFDHPAIFPESLARDHILSWSNEGDTVLDPFSGSGTTIKMARLMGRKGIGIEIHQEYCDIAVERLRQRLLF